MLYCRNLRGDFPGCLRWSLVSDTVQSRSSVIRGVNNRRARLFLYLAWLRECHWYTTESFFSFWDEVPLVSGNSGFTMVYTCIQHGKHGEREACRAVCTAVSAISSHSNPFVVRFVRRSTKNPSNLQHFDQVLKESSVPLGPLKKVPSPCCKRSRSGAVGNRNLGKLVASPQEIEKT